jgi:hypothetical protein
LFKKTFDDKFVMISGGPVERLRSDNAHALYRVRNKILSEHTGYSENELHHRFFKKLRLGVFEHEPEVEAKTPFQVATRFFRMSANEVTETQMSELMKEQESMAREINELDEYSEHPLELPEGRVTKALRKKYLQG